MPFVIEITFDGETREMELDKPELVVGRSTPAEEVDVDLNPDKLVSRKHFILKMEYNMGTAKNEAWIHDHGSSRGTTLNGEPVVEPTMIEKGDIIGVGETEMLVRLKKKPKKKGDMSFEEKVEARTKDFGSAPNPKSAPKPKPAEDPPPPPAPAEASFTSKPTRRASAEPAEIFQDESSPGVALSLLGDNFKTEAAGFVAFSIEDLATAVNRYSRENKMNPISASVVQEDKGSRASFRAMVVFYCPNTD
jgi:pSer/pThr/pTyr-binding forkhead associated (FHA) protein